MKTDVELAAKITEGLKGGRFVGMRVIGGAVNTFVLVFENEREQVGQLSFTPVLSISAIPNEVVVQPKVSISADVFPSDGKPLGGEEKGNAS